jgi:dCMP deaminase
VINAVVLYGAKQCYLDQNVLRENGMPNKFDYSHMIVAETYAKLSYANRLQVGAVVEKDNRIISIGYNGTPAGWDNTCEDTFEEHSTYIIDPGGPEYAMIATNTKTKPEVIHAEMNAIGKLAQSSESGLDATMYITHAPCFDCAKLIHIAGIKKVFYRNSYRNNDGIEFLNKCNIEVEKI